MTPNIFISSTIADLHYLRDALREAVLELAYNPIMSEYGEVGYINPVPASESCYGTMRQCQLAVLIMGRRYGSTGKDGLSVTHREFLTAKEHQIPTISFVEAEVLHYKKVYDLDKTLTVWKQVPGMDEAGKTFAFIDDVQQSEFYNGLLPITGASEAKRLLKQQIASFVGERLSDAVRPVKSEVQEILAEIKTLRKEINSPKGDAGDTENYLRAMRFLIDDRQAEFRKFCEETSRDIDTAVPLLITSKNLKTFVDALGIDTIMDADSQDAYDENWDKIRADSASKRYGSRTSWGWWIVNSNKKLFISTSMFQYFSEVYAKLQKNLNPLPHL